MDSTNPHIDDLPTSDQSFSDRPVGDPPAGDQPTSQLIGDLVDGKATPRQPVVGQPPGDAAATAGTPTAGTPTAGTPSAGTPSDRPSAESLRVAANSIREDIGKKLNDPTAVYVALGASDLVVERARQAAASAARQGAELAEKARSWNTQVSSDASDMPRLAVSRALKVAGHVEAAYADLASRGREVAERVREGRGGSDMVRRAVTTLSRRADGAAGSGTVVLGETVGTTQSVHVAPAEVGPIDVTDPVLVVEQLDTVDAVVVDPVVAADPSQPDAAGSDPTGDDVVSGGEDWYPARNGDAGRTSA